MGTTACKHICLVFSVYVLPKCHPLHWTNIFFGGVLTLAPLWTTNHTHILFIVWLHPGRQQVRVDPEMGSMLPMHMGRVMSPSLWRHTQPGAIPTVALSPPMWLHFLIFQHKQEVCAQGSSDCICSNCLYKPAGLWDKYGVSHCLGTGDTETNSVGRDLGGSHSTEDRRTQQQTTKCR